MLCPKTDGYETNSIVVIRHERREHIATPVTLSQVCRAWKDFTYHTPFLWDTVFVDMNDPHVTTYEDLAISKAAKKLKKWLDRAGNYPVTVKIKGPTLVHKPLLACFDRWKSIDVYCLGSHPELYAEIERIMKKPLPLLELFICRPSRHCNTLQNNHPRLSTMQSGKLSQVLTVFQLSLLSILPSRIKVSRWEWSVASDIMHQLKDMEGITDCFIYRPNMLFGVQNHPLSPPLQLSVLENLNLDSLRHCAYSYILKSLKLPKLQRFTFSNLSYARTPLFSVHAHLDLDILPLLLAFLRRSNSSNIQCLHFTISAKIIYADILLDILRTTSPTLKHFKLVLRGHYIGSQTSICMKQPSKVPDHITLSSLSSYHLDMGQLDHDSADNTALFKYLTLPNLQDFQVIFPPWKTRKINYISQVSYSAALGLVRRSKCPLKTLIINTEANIPKIALVHLLKAVPTLECLQLVGHNYNRTSKAKVKLRISSSLFDLLLPRSQSSESAIYLPRLRELSLEGTLTADWDGVLEALEYRWKGDEDCGIKSLSRVRLYTSNFFKSTSRKLRRRYEELQLQGMDVNFQKPFVIGENMAPVRY
ncbi:hypothetical protein BDQ17DRAFT_1432877 [Cyathus striatus]|nr:hypothetical protein BDQ17DRAFT_1432877 [Cyathus striatus]